MGWSLGGLVTLAADLGRALGGSAHLTGLRRTRIGALRVADAYRLDPLESIDPIEGAVVSMRDVLLHELPEVSVEGGAAFGVRNGRPLPADLAPAPPRADEALGMGELSAQREPCLVLVVSAAT